VSGDVVVRAATVEDAAAVLEIERGCDEAPHWDEGVWSQVFASYEFRGPKRRCFVAELSGTVVGFVVVSVLTVFAGGGIAEMESLAVREDVRRLGAGRNLCLQAMFWAQSQGAEVMQLEVRSRSAAARALYDSLGFLQQGIRRRYYESPVDDAVLMELRFGHEKQQR
jgi:ribosomal-protein-alanine N-acetyltransferase